MTRSLRTKLVRLARAVGRWILRKIVRITPLRVAAWMEAQADSWRDQADALPPCLRRDWKRWRARTWERWAMWLRGADRSIVIDAGDELIDRVAYLVNDPDSFERWDERRERRKRRRAGG